MTEKAHLHLIRSALDEGYFLSVFDEEDQLCEPSNNFSRIKNNVESVEHCYIRIWTRDGQTVGSVSVVFDHGQPPEEIIYDWACDSEGSWLNILMCKYHDEAAQA